MSSFKFIILNMITVCFCLTRYFKTISRRELVAIQVFPLRIVQYLRSGKEGKDGVWFTCCIEGREPEIHELWNFAEDGTRKVHPFFKSKSVTTSPGRLFTPIFQCKSTLNYFLGPHIRQRKCLMDRCSSTIFRNCSCYRGLD